MPVAKPRTARQAEPFDSARFDRANRIFFRLYQTSNLLHKVGTRSVAGFGATTQQWAVMGALAGNPGEDHGMTVKELMAYLMVSRQTITPLLARLKLRGWIECLKSQEDARSRRIYLTELGWSTWSEMQLPISSFYKSSLHEFSNKDELLLYQLLDKLKISMMNI